MKFNWLFFIESMILLSLLQYGLMVLGLTPGTLYYVIVFGAGFFMNNLLTWVHGRKMSLFVLDKDNEIK